MRLVWRQIFTSTWRTFSVRLKPIMENLRRHKGLIEAQASIHQFEAIQAVRMSFNGQTRISQEQEDLRRRCTVCDWLSAANMEEDHVDKVSLRSRYSGTCQWIMQNGKYRDWCGSGLQSLNVLWIKGIPGSGKFH